VLSLNKSSGKKTLNRVKYAVQCTLKYCAFHRTSKKPHKQFSASFNIKMRSRSKRTPLKYISMTFHRNGGHSFDGEVSLGKQSSSSTHHFHESTCELLQKLKQVAPEASGTFMALPSPGVSLLTGLSLLFCLWLMLFSSFSRTRPRRENRGKCYLSLKMSSCS